MHFSVFSFPLFLNLEHPTPFHQGPLSQLASSSTGKPGARKFEKEKLNSSPSFTHVCFCESRRDAVSHRWSLNQAPLPSPVSSRLSPSTKPIVPTIRGERRLTALRATLYVTLLFSTPTTELLRGIEVMFGASFAQTVAISRRRAYWAVKYTHMPKKWKIIAVYTVMLLCIQNGT